MLMLLAVVRGRIRGGLVAWLALATLAFNPIPAGISINARTWSDHVAASLPLVCMVVVLVFIARDAVHRRVRWYLVAWFVIAAWAFLHWPLWSVDSIHSRLPLWFWQLVLLSTGVAMASVPSSVRLEPPPDPSKRSATRTWHGEQVIPVASGRAW